MSALHLGEQGKRKGRDGGNKGRGEGRWGRQGCQGQEAERRDTQTQEQNTGRQGQAESSGTWVEENEGKGDPRAPPGVQFLSLSPPRLQDLARSLWPAEKLQREKAPEQIWA